MMKKTSASNNSRPMQEEANDDDDVYPEEAAEAGESTPLIGSTRSPSLTIAGHMSSSGLSVNTCSSAITPRQSNVTAVDDSRCMPPRVPSMSSTTSSSRYSKKNGSSRLPSRRQSSDISSRVVSFNGEDQNSNNGNQQQHQQQQVHSTFRRSKITTSTTLVILVLGSFLAICTLFQYFMIGPSSFSLPPDLDVKNNNDGDGNIIGNDNGGRQQGGQEAGGQTHHHVNNDNDVLFDEFGRIIIEDYDALRPFSEILPGVAGIYGKPLWVFYINRGQAISSFGVKSKDYPIMEFYSANNAYQNTAVLGFRTFYKGRRNYGNVLLGKKSHEFLVEPFDTSRTRFRQKKKKNSNEKEESIKLPERRMFIGANDVSIQEVDRVNKIETNVTYFNLPEEDFGAFVKRTTITNLASDNELHLSVLDGLSRIQPVGGKLELMLKMIGRTLQGFMQVHHAEGSRSLPFFRMSEAANDNAAVVLEEGGHFVIAYIENEEKLLPIVYDTNKIFGDDTSLLHPLGLYEKSIKDILREKQYGLARTSSAFAAVEDVTILPGQSITITTFYGRADTIDDLPIIARKVAHGGWAQYKLSRARALIQQITSGAETVTANHVFDKHVEQMALDNALMGGVPVLLGEVDDDAHSQNADDDERIKVFHLFSRRGDLERDYDEFIVENTYFSEGPSNFRDVIQSRRNDVIFNPRVGAFNFKMFLSLIQADGYNPRSIEAVVFSIDNPEVCMRLATNAVGYADGHRAQREALSSILCDGEFRPGQLVQMIEEQNIFLMTSLSTLIDDVAASSKVSPAAVSKGDGFAADHFSYIMDLLHAYLEVYPDKEEHLLFNQNLTYYYSSRVVAPRKSKYVLSKSYDGESHHIRQLDATYENTEKLQHIQQFINPGSGWYKNEATIQRDVNGRIFKSSPIEKLFLLATIKFATRDPYGVGIEYEAGKPGWNEALNGLSSMMGSGVAELIELKILMKYINNVALKFSHRTFVVPEELAVLIGKITAALDELGDEEEFMINLRSGESLKVPHALFLYWDAVATAREEYRADVTLFSGETKEYSSQEIVKLTKRWLKEIDLGIARAHAIGSHGHEKKDVSPTYFSYNVTRWEETKNRNKDGHKFVIAKEMVVSKFPLFLDGVTHVMKTMDKVQAINLYETVKQSGLRDKELNMYTVSSTLAGQSYDMGRMMGFAPGWLENQSVWMSQSYKYYLELIKKGMFDQFFEEARSGMLPFIDGSKYGRSLIECSSFIASSAFEDPNIRGRGVLARLSGATAEFLSIWKQMFIGQSLFRLNDIDGKLEMQLVPSLPAWLFKRNEIEQSPADEQYVIRFKLFQSINVAYFSATPKDLLGSRPLRYTIGLRDGSMMSVNVISSTLAANIRRVVWVDYIHAYF